MKERGIEALCPFTLFRITRSMCALRSLAIPSIALSMMSESKTPSNRAFLPVVGSTSEPLARLYFLSSAGPIALISVFGWVAAQKTLKPSDGEGEAA